MKNIEIKNTQDSITPEKLALALVKVVDDNFGIKIETREERQEIKVINAAMYLLEKDLVTKLGNNFDKSKLEEIVNTFFGNTEELKISTVMVAQTMAIFYPQIPNKPQAAIKYLVNYFDTELQGKIKEEQEEKANSQSYMANISQLMKNSKVTSINEDLSTIIDFDELPELPNV